MELFFIYKFLTSLYPVLFGNRIKNNAIHKMIFNFSPLPNYGLPVSYEVPKKWVGLIWE